MPLTTAFHPRICDPTISARNRNTLCSVDTRAPSTTQAEAGDGRDERRSTDASAKFADVESSVLDCSYSTAHYWPLRCTARLPPANRPVAYRSVPSPFVLLVAHLCVYRHLRLRSPRS